MLLGWKITGDLLKEIKAINKMNKTMSFGSWKFSKGLRYMSDFTYKNAKGELFDVDVVNNLYNDYYNKLTKQ